MRKYKYILLCNGIALLAVFLFLNLGWQTQTVLGAPQTTGQEQFSQTHPNQLSVIEQLNNLFPGTMANISRRALQGESSLLACSVEATGDNVTDFTSADASAVQAAVDSAAPGSLLRVAGTCMGVQSRNSLVQTVYINRSVTIKGGYNANDWSQPSNPNTFPTLLDAGGNGRVVYIISGSPVVLDSLNLAHGNDAIGDGGGIYAATNVVWSLLNSTVSESNSGALGGGIYNASTQFTMANSTIMNNTAGTFGGGLQTSRNTVVTINNSVVHHNSATLGGGIHLSNGGRINLTASTIEYNHATGSGGGLANDSNTGIIHVNNSTIFSNTAGDSGAGIFNNGRLTLNNTTVGDNEAVDDGGGLLNHVNGNVTIMNSVIENNRAFDPGNMDLSRGAGIYNRSSGVVTVMTSTIQFNAANDNGGAVWNESVFNLVGSTMLGNSSGNNGGGMWNSGTLNINRSQVLSNTSPNNAGGLLNTKIASISRSTFAFNGANDGGGVYNTNPNATLSIAASTFHDNYAEGPGANRGGGVYINMGRLTLVNSTLSHNRSSNEGGGLVNGGISRLRHATIVNNIIGVSTGSGLYNFTAGSVMTLTNTAVAYNSGPATDTECGVVAGTVVDNGYNIIQDGTCISAGTSFSADPLLGSLANNGGNTQTHLPLPFSPVIDAIPTPKCAAANDQIGVARPVDGACDIGSVELAVNYAPVAVADNYNATEDTPLTVPAPGILANDSDGDKDTLQAVLNSSVSHGSLTLNSNGSFTYTPQTNFCGADGFTYHAFDGQLSSGIVSVTLNVACVPDVPVAVKDVYATDENVPIMVVAPGVLANDSDGDGDALTAVLNTTVLTGSLTFASDGSFTYTPALNWSGIATFTYHAEAGGDSSNIALVSLVVGAVNDAPVAVDDTYITAEDTPLTITAPGVLSNDSDADGDPLTAVLDSNVLTGTLTFASDGSFTYTPPINWSGVATFTYHANDDLFDSNTAVVTITVTAVNDMPVAADDDYIATEDVALIVAAPGVLANDSDTDGDPLTAVLNTTVLTGSLTLASDGSFTYTPLLNWSGIVTFTYHAEAGGDSSNIALVTLVVNSVNDAPVAVDDAYTTPPNTPLAITAPGVLANDSDVDGDSLMVSLESTVITGTVILTADGSFNYVPPVGWSGVTTFTYYATDDLANSNLAVVTITTTGNQSPVANNDTYAMDEDSVLTIAAPGVLGNDSDDEGDPLTAVLNTSVANGIITLNSNGSFTYTPNADFCGTDSFTYHANDGQTNSNIATVTLNVACINDEPVAVADSYAVDENSSDNVLDVLTNDSEPDGNTITIVSVTTASQGTALISGANILYTPNPNFVGIDTFTYTISDGALMDTATVTVTVGQPSSQFVLYLPAVLKQ